MKTFGNKQFRPNKNFYKAKHKETKQKKETQTQTDKQKWRFGYKILKFRY